MGAKVKLWRFSVVNNYSKEGKMKHKTSCHSIFVAVFIAMFIISPICANAATTLRLGHIFPITHPVQKATTAMADYVAKQTNGEVEIKVYSGGALGKGKNLAESIHLGTVAMGTAGPGLLSRLEPAWGLIAGEYVFKDMESMFKVLNGPVGDDIKNRLIKKRGIRALGIGYLGQRNITANKPIYKPEDMKGLKIRIPNIPLRKASFLAVGAAPTPMAFSEVQGVVDCQENPLPQIVTAKFYEVQKYLILSGHALNPEILLINEKKFSDLPASAQGILKEGAKVYEDTLLTEFKTMKLALLEKILDAGVIVMKPDTEAFSKAVRDVPYQFEDKWGKGLYDRVLKAQE
jgi:tripartite ATP-independent transporter DctP family solute receptor